MDSDKPDPQQYSLDRLLTAHGSIYFPSKYYDDLPQKTKDLLENSGRYVVNRKDYGLSISFA
jgi:hypothetical protein